MNDIDRHLNLAVFRDGICWHEELSFCVSQASWRFQTVFNQSNALCLSKYIEGLHGAPNKNFLHNKDADCKKNLETQSRFAFFDTYMYM